MRMSSAVLSASALHAHTLRRMHTFTTLGEDTVFRICGHLIQFDTKACYGFKLRESVGFEHFGVTDLAMLSTIL